MSAINTTSNALHLGNDDLGPLDLKSIHQRGFKWMMTLLFALTCLGTVLVIVEVFGAGWIGLWVALLLAPLVGLRITQIYRWATRTHKLRRSLAPGVAPCPRCGSMQTDLCEQEHEHEHEHEHETRIVAARVCFNCELEWA